MIFTFVPDYFCCKEYLVTKAGAFDILYAKNESMYWFNWPESDQLLFNSLLVPWQGSPMAFYIHIGEPLQLPSTALTVQASLPLLCACILVYYFQFLVAFCYEKYFLCLSVHLSNSTVHPSWVRWIRMNEAVINLQFPLHFKCKHVNHVHERVVLKTFGVQEQRTRTLQWIKMYSLTQHEIWRL